MAETMIMAFLFFSVHSIISAALPFGPLLLSPQRFTD